MNFEQFSEQYVMSSCMTDVCAEESIDYLFEHGYEYVSAIIMSMSCEINDGRAFYKETSHRLQDGDLLAPYFFRRGESPIRAVALWRKVS